ncbi:MAG: antibiotic biosynthesis monooxygenase [Chloroflexota bacterium]
MIIVSNRISVNPDHAEAFEDRFANRASRVDGQAGFIAFQLLRPTQAGEPYVVMTMWESMADFDAWRNAPEFKEGHKGGQQLPEGAVLGRPQLEIHDVISSTLTMSEG